MVKTNTASTVAFRLGRTSTKDICGFGRSPNAAAADVMSGSVRRGMQRRQTMNRDLGVWTYEDCALVLIDYQKEMFQA